MAEEKFPPDGYVPTLSNVAGIEIFMPAPKIEQLDVRVDFACPNCRGVQAYNVSDGGLSCTSCGYYQPPKGMRVGGAATSNEFRTEESERQKEERIRKSLGVNAAVTAAAASIAAASSPSPAQAAKIADDYNWGEERRELSCTNCGASILLAAEALTHVCPFCGSSSVNQHAFLQDKLRPRYLIPFNVEVEKAKASIMEWLGSSWMTPGDLQKRAGLDNLIGTFLPYWTFTATCSSTWKAEVGHDRTESYTDSNGNRHSRTVTDWRWESGYVNLPIRDLLVSGTSKLNARLLDEVDQFSMTGLVEYETSYLAGYNAQTFDVGRDVAWTKGRELMREMTKSACYGQASTSKVRNFSMTLDYSDESWRYVLLPVYLSSYSYDSESFSLMVNGQTALISGQRPVDWRKIIAVCVLSYIPGLIVALAAFFRWFNITMQQTKNVYIAAGILLLVAVVASIALVVSAMNIRKKAD